MYVGLVSYIIKYCLAKKTNQFMYGGLFSMKNIYLVDIRYNCLYTTQNVKIFSKKLVFFETRHKKTKEKISSKKFFSKIFFPHFFEEPNSPL